MTQAPKAPKLTLVPIEEVSNASRRTPSPDGLPEEGHPLPASGPHAAPCRGERTAPGKTDAGRPRRASDMEMLRPAKPRRFGRFDLLLEMGKGGMATLYLARLRGPEHFEKLLAIKRIHDHLTDEPEFVNMFLDEARIAARVHHPNVAAIYDLGVEEGQHFLSMEYVHGQTLADILKRAVSRPDPFPWPLAARIVADAAAGLHAAHQLADDDGRALGVVHRDVSPHNVLISYDGHVKVIDFGIAYAAHKLAHTGVGILKGKTGYMSPEQVDGKPLDARSDVFALGIVLYECITRSRLFYAESDTATLLKVREAQVPSLRARVPGLPGGLEAIVMKALARRPEDRYASAEELSEALDQLLMTYGEATGPKRLAEMMDELFRERKQVKDQQIRMALHRRDPTLVSDPLLSAPPELSCTRPVVRGGRRSGLLWSAIGGALILGAVLAWALMGHPKTVTAPPTPAAARPPRAQIAPRPAERLAPMVRPGARATATPPAVPATLAPAGRVTLTVTVQAPKRGVTMKLDGAWYPGRKGRFVVPRGSRAVSVLVRARGYRDRVVPLVPDRDRQVEVSLDRRRGRRSARHSARSRRTRKGGDQDGLLRFEQLGGGRSRHGKSPRPRTRLLDL